MPSLQEMRVRLKKLQEEQMEMLAFREKAAFAALREVHSQEPNSDSFAQRGQELWMTNEEKARSGANYYEKLKHTQEKLLPTGEISDERAVVLETDWRRQWNLQAETEERSRKEVLVEGSAGWVQIYRESIARENAKPKPNLEAAIWNERRLEKLLPQLQKQLAVVQECEAKTKAEVERQQPAQVEREPQAQPVPPQPEVPVKVEQDVINKVEPTVVAQVRKDDDVAPPINMDEQLAFHGVGDVVEQMHTWTDEPEEPSPTGLKWYRQPEESLHNISNPHNEDILRADPKEASDANALVNAIYNIREDAHGDEQLMKRCDARIEQLLEIADKLSSKQPSVRADHRLFKEAVSQTREDGQKLDKDKDNDNVDDHEQKFEP